MNNFEHMNFFFFITTVSVVLISIFICVGLFYCIRLLRSIENSFEVTKERIGELADNIDEVKEEFLQSPVIQLVTSFAQKKRRKKYEKENNVNE